MHAETHQVGKPIDSRVVLDLLTSVLGVGDADGCDVPLADMALDDDLSIYHLWEAVLEEFGGRSTGNLALDVLRPRTLGELAAVFDDALRS